MPWLRFLVPVEDLREGLDAIRAEQRVPAGFPAEVEALASQAAARGLPAALADPSRRDERDIPLITIDPPGSRDLDQAYFAERIPGGYRVRYAIADVGAFVRPGGALDEEAWRRGLTLYLPDGRSPLYPPELSEGAASLLPGEDRPAVLWTIELDAEGGTTDARLERAVVRSRTQLTYEGVQSALDEDRASEPELLLREIGLLLQRREADRQGISLSLPVREVRRTPEGYDFGFEAPLPVEGWNAQISLLAGYAAADIMLRGGAGLLRTLPPVESRHTERLRRVAEVLGIPWPAGATLADMVRTQDGRTPASAAFLTQATQALRGAAYTPVQDGPTIHGGLGLPYAHVTAPLRRLADRYANEITVALCAGTQAPAWALEAIPRLPEAMGEADRRSDRVEGEILNLAEAVVLRPQVGEVFGATVIDLGRERATIQLHDPPVVIKMPSEGFRLGETVRLRLLSASPAERRLEFRTER
jgi:exoribonuclease R